MRTTPISYANPGVSVAKWLVDELVDELIVPGYRRLAEAARSEGGRIQDTGAVSAARTP